MNDQFSISRRVLVKSSVFSLLAASLPNIVYSRSITPILSSSATTPHDRYPAIRLEVAADVVGVSHFNLDRLKELVEPRPELAKASWDWGYGDWESALGAASHVGRKDIIEYLLSRGANPNIFTYAVLGQVEAVRSMIESSPGIQKNLGPHGISLLQHARTGLATEGVDKQKAQRLVDYLQSLGDADGQHYLPMDETEKSKYLGDYKYGEGKEDGFSVKLNMRKIISLGRPGKSGGALLRIGEQEFVYQGAPSVIISFQFENTRVISLTIQEPGLILKAMKI